MMFVDTWGFKAFIDRKEPKHSEVKQLLEKAWKKKDSVYTSDYIIDETITLISYKLDFDKLKKFIVASDAAIEKGYIGLLRVSPDDFGEAKKFKLKYKDKLKISFTDITSAILMRNHKITDIVTEDEHFGEIGMGFNVLFADN